VQHSLQLQQDRCFCRLLVRHPTMQQHFSGVVVLSVMAMRHLSSWEGRQKACSQATLAAGFVVAVAVALLLAIFLLLEPVRLPVRLHVRLV
jgi:hypothetical protein